MKHTLTRTLTLVLAILLCLPLVACGASADTKETTASDAAQQEVTLDKELKIDIMVLSGTTGVGIAPLMNDVKNGNAALNYNIEVASSADLINPGLIQGEVEIAALPTNVASVLYNKTGGKIMVAAVNTKGVLYLLENGETVKSFADLKGKTVYLPGQGSNPEYIFRYLAEKNGLEIGKDVTVDYTYGSPDELATAITTGLVSLAVLPEPKVTAIKSQNAAVRSALDFTAEWNRVSDGELVQGCIVVQKSFAEEHPAELAQFLKDYEASIQFVNTNIEEASTMIEAAGIIPKAPLAKKALPACNICFISGEEMKASLVSFYQVLFGMAPASVGGALPDDGIYYLP
ncbi:MAG: ABC transporter substrate-binding protein [Clostridia bacterium]|nr:ABC transporter substrate-binding protein [Clostridia bacterium]